MKYLLLAKANVRKTKGLTFGLVLLIMIAACFLNVFLLINLDFNKNAKNVAKDLNTEDFGLLITGNINELSDTYLKNVDKENITDFEFNEILTLVSDLPYNNGIVTANIVIGNMDLFTKKMGKFEILEEDASIKENYIYLPYQFYTGGGYKLGDNFKFKILNKEYEYTIKGFINTITLGSNNVGAYQLILDLDSYNIVKANSEGLIDGIYAKYQIKDDINQTKFANKIANDILKDYPELTILSTNLESAISGRTFLGTIFSALLLIVCVVVLVIVTLMISNNISNFIRENIKTLGALKAIGYTSRDITISFILEFILITWLGSWLGVISSIFVMQLIGNIMVMQSAIPYTAHFHIIGVVITELSIIFLVFITLLILLRKIKTIEPIVALREGLNGKKLKKNVVPLESSKLPLNFNLGLKTTFSNIGQNITIFIVTIFLMFMSTLSLVLFENFSLKPKVSIMTFEICDGIIVTDEDEDNRIFNYLNNLKETDNVRLVAMNSVKVDDANLVAYILDDTKKFENRDVIYEGDFPTKNNEIAVSGKFASVYDYKIGDQITVNNGSKSATLTITGFIQSLNNNGMEAMLLKETADTLLGTNYDKSYYFNVKDGKVDNVFDKTKSEFDNKIKSTMDFEKAKDGALGTFKTIAFLLVVLVVVINTLILLLVLYMLIKTLINKKQKDYGILKALGYTSKQIILQNALSFLPVVIISTLIGSILSTLLMNKIIAIVMSSFGIMKLTLNMPIVLIIIFGIAFVLLAFILSILLSRKIKKIEPYKLLIGD